MSNLLSANWIDPDELQEAVDSIKSFKPTILILPHTLFMQYLNTFALYPGEGVWLKSSLRKIGIRRLIWADYLKKGEFELCSEEQYQDLLIKQPDLESATLKEK